MTVIPPAGTGVFPTGGGGGPLLSPPPPQEASAITANPMYPFFIVTSVPSGCASRESAMLAVVRSLGGGSNSSNTVHCQKR